MLNDIPYRLLWRCFFWAVAGLLPSLGQANDLASFGAVKGKYFLQTSNGAPVPYPGQPWYFHAFVSDRNPDDNLVQLATVSQVSMTLNDPGAIDAELFDFFPDQAALENTWANGDYDFSITTVNDGAFGSLLTLAGNAYPNVPHLSNLPAAQAVDPAADFILRWDAFTGGRTNDLIDVLLFDDFGFSFETGFAPGPFSALDGLATSFVIPAGALQANSLYHAVLVFQKRVAADPSAATVGLTGYESATAFDIQTTALRRSPSDVFPVAVTDRNEVAYDLAFGGGVYLAAVQGSQNFAPGSTQGEITAVLLRRDGSVVRNTRTGRVGSAQAVVFGAGRFLMVWEDAEGPIYGQFVLPSGDLSGAVFPISDDFFGAEEPDVAFDGTNFLVTWTARDGFGEYTQPRARLIEPGDVLAHNPFALASDAVNVVVAAGGGKFLAVAVDSDEESGVYGQFITAAGALTGPIISIDITPAGSGGPKEVFFDPVAQRFVVLFTDGASLPGSDLFARTVDLSGNVGLRKLIATGAGFQGAPKIASDGHLLLLTWDSGVFSPTVTSRARFFNSDLNPVGEELSTFVQHGSKVPYVAPVQFDGSRYLIVNSSARLVTQANGDHVFLNGDTYARFIVPNTPGIAAPPHDQSVAVGAAANFSVEATGPPPLTYQWQRNGANLPGQTGSELALSGVGLAQAGAYRVVVGNGAGSTISPAAQLTVLQTPTILVQPQPSLLVGFSQDIVFNVVAGGDGPFMYQWRFNGLSLPGETNASLTVQSAVATQGSYSVTVANLVGATNSAEAALTLQGPALDFQDSFANRNVIGGGDAFGGFGGGTNTGATKEAGEPSHAGKTGGASVWYGWVAPDDGVVTFATTGSGFDTLLAVYTGTSVNQLTPVVSDDDSGGAFASRVTFNVTAGVEYIIAVDGLGARTGRIFLSWEFGSSTVPAPVITASPASRTVPAGSAVLLVVTVQSSTAAQYQWFKDGLEISGATTNPFVLPSFQPSDIGSYVVRVGNDSAFTTFSAPAFIELGSAASVTTADKFEDARADRIILGTTLAGHGPPKSLGAPAAGTVMTHNYGSTRESGEPNHGGVIGGASRWFVVQPSAAGTLAIDTVGSDFDTVLAVYTGPSYSALTLVAQDNDGAPDGQRSRVRFNTAAGVDYHIAVDGVGGAQGNITLNYRFGTAPQIVEGPASQTAFVGSDFTLHVVAAASDLVYVWKRNGVRISGATNAELTVSKCLQLDQGTYTVEVSNPLGTAARAANVTVFGPNTPPSVTLTAPLPSALFVFPTNLQLTASADGNTLARVEFFQNKKKIGESLAAPYTISWTPPKAGNYTLTAKATDGNGRATVSAPVTITVLLPVSIVRQPLPVSVPAGKTARFKVIAKGSAPLTYQWLFNGNVIGNAVKSSFSVANVQSNLLGNYSVRVSNRAGVVESSPAALTFKP